MVIGAGAERHPDPAAVKPQVSPVGPLGAPQVDAYASKPPVTCKPLTRPNL